MKLVAQGYSVTPLAAKQVPFTAAAIDEPPPHIAVDMLAALPEDEAAFYGCESNVVDYIGKSQVIADEIAHQYSFFGGEHAQWVEYLNRRDVAPDTWTFALRHQIRAVSGVSAVPKKTLGRQRKLLMSCVTN